MSNEELVLLYQNGDKSALDRLYSQNKGLIIRVANKYKGVCEYEDMCQEGYFGLQSAIEKYSSDIGTRFSTYAVIRINQSIRRFIDNNRSMIRIPVYQTELIAKYNKLVSEYEKSHCGESPSDKAICAKMAISSKKLQEIRNSIAIQTVTHLEVKDENGEELINSIACEGDFVEDIANDRLKKQLYHQLGECLKELSDIQYKIICMRSQGVPDIVVREKLNISQQELEDATNNALELIKCSRRYKMLEQLEIDIFGSSIRNNSLGRFQNTWTSSTEHIAIKSVENKKKYMAITKNILNTSTVIDRKFVKCFLKKCGADTAYTFLSVLDSAQDKEVLFRRFVLKESEKDIDLTVNRCTVNRRINKALDNLTAYYEKRRFDILSYQQQ